MEPGLAASLVSMGTGRIRSGTGPGLKGTQIENDRFKDSKASWKPDIFSGLHWYSFSLESTRQRCAKTAVVLSWPCLHGSEDHGAAITNRQWIGPPQRVEDFPRILWNSEFRL